MSKTEIPVPGGFEQVTEGPAILVARQEYIKPIRKVFSPLYQAWARMAQRRFSARGRAGIVSFPLGDGPAMMVRRYFHGGLFAKFGRDLYLGPDRALTELNVAAAAHAGGVRTPEPIGILAVQAAGPFWRAAFLSAEISESEDLIHYCCRLGEYPAETAATQKRGVIREAATQIRKMHDLGIFHADLHLKNLLLRRRTAGAPEVFVIDFDKAMLGQPLTPEMRFRNLKRLARSVRKLRVADTVLSPYDRLRFLRDYLRGAPNARTLMRQWARALAVSGRAHEVWWTATRAQRTLRGDKVARAAALKRDFKKRR